MFAPFGGAAGSDGEPPVKTEPTQASKDFHAKFAASRDGVALPAGTPGAEPPAKESIEPEAVKPEAEPVVKPIEKKLPGGNLPKILADKRQAEQEREELRGKLEAFEKTEKPALEKKVSELEAKISEGGHTVEELGVLKDKLDIAEKKLVEREDSLVNENKTLRSQLAFHDIQADPDFRKEFVQPMVNAYSEAVESFQSDEAKVNLLRKALLANSASLSASKPEERMAQEKERNAVLSQLSDSLDEFSRGQFTQAMNAYIRATKAHAKALGEHENTRLEISKKRESEQSRRRTEIFSNWTKHNDTIAPNYDAEIKLEGELAEAVKELKLDPTKDVESAGNLVRKIITGQGSMEDSVEILNRGRIYPALVAKTKAQEHIIKGLRDTIKKLRGTKPGGETKDGREGNVEHKETREDFNRRFSAGRPGAMRAAKES